MVGFIHIRGELHATEPGGKTGFSHCTKIVPVKSHNDFSRHFGEQRSCVIQQEPILFGENDSHVMWLHSCRILFQTRPVAFLRRTKGKSENLKCVALGCKQRTAYLVWRFAPCAFWVCGVNVQWCLLQALDQPSSPIHGVRVGVN